MDRVVARGCPRCGWPSVEGAACPRCGAQVDAYRAEMARATFAAPPREAAPAGAPAALAPAGFWIRAAASVIDGLVLLPLHLVPVLWVLLGWAYPIVFHWLWGQTLGKMAMRIRVVTVQGEPLTLGTSVLRWVGYWLSALLLLIGYLMVAFREDKRALHDLLAGTRVVRLAQGGG